MKMFHSSYGTSHSRRSCSNLNQQDLQATLPHLRARLRLITPHVLTTYRPTRISSTAMLRWSQFGISRRTLHLVTCFHSMDNIRVCFLSFAKLKGKSFDSFHLVTTHGDTCPSCTSWSPAWSTHAPWTPPHRYDDECYDFHELRKQPGATGQENFALPKLMSTSSVFLGGLLLVSLLPRAKADCYVDT